MGMTRFSEIRHKTRCNIYAVQQDTQSFLMIEFIHHIC